MIRKDLSWFSDDLTDEEKQILLDREQSNPNKGERDAMYNNRMSYEARNKRDLFESILATDDEFDVIYRDLKNVINRVPSHVPDEVVIDAIEYLLERVRAGKI